jgi:DNA polymerase-1
VLKKTPLAPAAPTTSPTELALALITSARALVIDCETTGLEPHSDRVCGWVFAAEGVATYIPVRHQGGNAFDDPGPFERDLARAFAQRAQLGLLTIAHNFPFDAWFAAREGVVIEGRIEDTMLNAVLINDDLRAYDLEACCLRHEVQPKKTETIYAELQHRFGRGGKASAKAMKHFHKLAGNDPLAREYATGDGISTLELWHAQQPLLDDLGLRKVHALECALLPRLAAMRRRGIRVDLDYARAAKRALEGNLAAEMMLLPSGFEANSTASVRDYMISQGITLFPRTAKGADSFREKFLESCGEPGQRVNKVRRLLKTRGTFIEPILTTHASQGRIHPDLVQFATGDYGTHTGRFSCRMPNLQAFPKRNKEIGQIVRPILVPDDGMVFGEADVRQQEPRFYAHYGEDANLIAGYNSDPPTDVHSIASAKMGIDRDRAKTLILSIFNGMGSRALAGRLDIPSLQASVMIADFLDLFPGIARFKRDAPQVAEDRGFIRTIYGRRCYFTDPRSTYMAVSRVIQGSASDQMKLMMLRAFEYCEANPQVQLLMSIHDSLMFQAERGVSLLDFQACLEDNSELNLLVPMPVDLKTGRHWGEASYPGAYDSQSSPPLPARSLRTRGLLRVAHREGEARQVPSPAR